MKGRIVGMKKLGILGGTFDPIHIGHLMIGECAYQEAGLDKVLIMPTGNPPHKNGSTITSFPIRRALTELAIEDNPHFEFSDLEIKRQGIIYTSDTLEILQNMHKDAELYFIMGEDSLDYFDKWHEPDRIVELARILVSVRSVNEDFVKKLQEMNAKYKNRFTMLKTPFVDISSSDIRKRSSEGKTIRYMVKDKVAEYIEKEAIYKDV